MTCLSQDVTPHTIIYTGIGVASILLLNYFKEGYSLPATPQLRDLTSGEYCSNLKRIVLDSLSAIDTRGRYVRFQIEVIVLTWNVFWNSFLMNLISLLSLIIIWWMDDKCNNAPIFKTSKSAPAVVWLGSILDALSYAFLPILFVAINTLAGSSMNKIIPGATLSRNPVSHRRDKRPKPAQSNVFSRTRRLSPHPGTLIIWVPRLPTAYKMELPFKLSTVGWQGICMLIPL